MNATFDTLAFSDRLKAAGASEELSDALARAIQDVAMNDVATKADIREAVHNMTVRVGAMIGGAVALLGVLISLH